MGKYKGRKEGTAWDSVDGDLYHFRYSEARVPVGCSSGSAREASPLYPWLVNFLEHDSPNLIVVLTVAGILGRYIIQQHKTHLDSKEKEIERLVKERDKLQDHLLKQRLSTTDTGKSDKRGKQT